MNAFIIIICRYHTHTYICYQAAAYSSGSALFSPTLCFADMLPHPTLLFTLASCVPYSLNLDGYTLLFRILGICLKLRTSCFPFSRRLFGNVCELAWKIVKQCLKCINVQFNIVYQQAMVFSQRVNKFLFTPLRIISLNCLLLRTCCVCYPRPS